MQRAVESAQLDGLVAVEEGVQVQKMVAAFVVVCVPVSPVAFVPDALDLGEGGRLGSVHGRHKVLVHPLAVAGPLGFYAKSLVEEVVSGVDDIHEVSDRARCVRRPIKVDVDAAGAVGEGSSLPQRPDDLLQVLDISFVSEDRADQLDAVQARCTLFDPSRLGFASDATVVGELPCAAIEGLQFVGVVVGATVG